MMKLLQTVVALLLLLLSSNSGNGGRSLYGCWAWNTGGEYLRVSSSSLSSQQQHQHLQPQKWHRGIQQQQQQQRRRKNQQSEPQMGMMTVSPTVGFYTDAPTPQPTLQPITSSPTRAITPQPSSTPPPSIQATPSPTPPPSIQITPPPPTPPPTLQATSLPPSPPPTPPPTPQPVVPPTVVPTPYPTPPPTLAATATPSLEPTPSPFTFAPSLSPIMPTSPPIRIVPLVPFAMNLTATINTPSNSTYWSVGNLSQFLNGFMQSFLEQQLSSQIGDTSALQSIQLQLLRVHTQSRRLARVTTTSRITSTSTTTVSGQWVWRGVATLLAKSQIRTTFLQQVQVYTLLQNTTVLSNQLQVYLLQDNIFTLGRTYLQGIQVHHVLLNPDTVPTTSNNTTTTTTTNTTPTTTNTNTNNNKNNNTSSPLEDNNAASANNPTKKSNNSKTNVGLIVGLACGGLIMALAILLLIGPVRRYRRNLKVPPPPPNHPPPLAKCPSKPTTMFDDDENAAGQVNYEEGIVAIRPDDKEQSSRVSTPSTVRDTPTSTPEGVEVSNRASSPTSTSSTTRSTSVRSTSGGGGGGDDVRVTVADRALQLVLADPPRQREPPPPPSGLALRRLPDYYAPRSAASIGTASRPYPVGIPPSASTTTEECGMMSLGTVSMEDDTYSLPAAENLQIQLPPPSTSPGAYQWLKGAIHGRASANKSANNNNNNLPSHLRLGPQDDESTSSFTYDRVGSGGSLEPTSSREEDLLDMDGSRLSPIRGDSANTPTRANNSATIMKHPEHLILEPRPSTSNDDDDESDTDPSHPYRQLLSHTWQSPKRSMYKPGKEEQMLLEEMRLMGGVGADASLLSGSSLLSTSTSSSSSVSNARRGKMLPIGTQISPPRPSGTPSSLSAASRGQLLPHRRGLDDTATSTSDVPSDEWNSQQEQDLEGFVAQIEDAKNKSMLDRSAAEDTDDDPLSPPRLTHHNNEGAFRPNVSYLSSTSSSPPPPPPPSRANAALSSPPSVKRVVPQSSFQSSPGGSLSPRSPQSPLSSQSPRASTRPPRTGGGGESSGKSSSGKSSSGKSTGSSGKEELLQDETLSQFLRDRRRAKRAARKQRESRKQPPLSMEV